ncbi:MAG: aminopeptidase P family N-terminal domain-containing protein [Bacteroidales bacterium]|nr:aminopeptidase P family N-terminal domain-containing protein [Bacteroidales bacterium]
MDRRQVLDAVRRMLADKGADAVIVPSNDCHFGEYVPDCFKVREWLSGFDGSAGTLVVTTSEAALWTDSRYFIQAARQLEGSGIALMKLKIAGTPSIPQWLHSQNVAKVIVDGDLFSRREFLSLGSELSPAVLEAVDDPFREIWKDRPALVSKPIVNMPESISGASIEDKRRAVAGKLGCKGAYAYIVSACDEIMWLCNLRGEDIEYNPVALSYCVMTENCIHLFCHQDSLTPEARNYLEWQHVVLHEYGAFRDFLRTIPAGVTRICQSSSINVNNWNAALATVQPSECDACFKEDPTAGGSVAWLRSRKNAVELKGFRKAFINDGVAWVKLLKFIDDNLHTGRLNEFMLAEKLKEFRGECPDYLGESFEPIVAWNANAASAHYSVTCEADAAKIQPYGFLLMDTGAHYPYGTTDTTRTLMLSDRNDFTGLGDRLLQQMRDDYTLVLKGMIDLASAVFPAGTRGSQLDILARGPMYPTGKMYYHGTSHGIGHHLCVHEAPQIRMEESPLVIDEGMVLSDEPAIYIEGQYGIRTENVITVVPHKETSYGKFFKFDTMTLVPIDMRPVNFKLLTHKEEEWLYKYNEHVYETLKPHLSKQEAVWLWKKTTV